MTRHILKKTHASAYIQTKACYSNSSVYRASKDINRVQSCIATAKKYRVTKNTVSHRLKKKAEIFDTVKGNNASIKRKRVKTATYEQLDSVLCKWLKTTRHSNCDIFKEKALEFAKSLEIQDFDASER